MKHPKIPPDNPSLLLCLALLRNPVRIRALSQLLQLGEGVVQEHVQALKKIGLLIYDKASGMWSAASEGERQTLGNRAAHLVQNETSGDLAKGLALLWTGRLLEGAVLAEKELGRLIYEGLSPGALACLDILLQSLEKWEESGHSPEENERFMRVAQKILGVVLYLAKRRRQANAVFAVLIRTAESLGDRRTVLKVKMMQVCLHYLIGGVLEEDPEEIIEEITKEIHELGDDDILIGTAHGAGIRHYINAEFAEAVATYRLYNSALNEEEKFYSGIAVNSVAISACNLGRFGHAIGTVLLALRTYDELGGKYGVKRSMILGGEVLLRAGMPDEALQMMDAAWTCCDAESESRLTIWAMCNLSFYHFQKQNMVYSHRLLTTCAEVAVKYNVQWPFRWFPDFFEMIWKFQELGLPPIPGYGLDEYLNRVHTDPSLQTQGIALRLRARMLNQNGRHKAALPFLEAALARLLQCGNPMEQARTKLEMAKTLDGLGRNAEAKALHAEGCRTLEEYNQYDRLWHCTEDELFTRPQSQVDGGECVSSWRGRFLDSTEWSSFALHLRWVIDCLRDALRVERVALYTVENDYLLVNLAARDFTAKEYNEKLPFIYSKRLLDSIQTGRISRWRSRYGACLCLPLRISAQRNCVFLAHCTYLVNSIMDRDLSYFEPIRIMVEEEVRLAYRVEKSVTAIELKKETRSRLAAERVVNEGGIYYGPAVYEVIEQADKAAPTAAPVLILGETGAGKEELARRVHRKSGRTGPFVAINPSSIPEQLFESELFGHEKGAFTGAHQQKLGVLELADKGTLFIDEVGEIPQALQVKLLRVLQDKHFARLGGTKLLHSDFRLISATNQDLTEKIHAGSFREDLYYRIAVVPVAMPPLRERPEDVKHLATMFHSYFSSQYKISVPPMTGAELEYLCSRPWKGNVRELRSFIERGVILYDPARGGFLQEAWAGQDGQEEKASRVTDGEQESIFTCADLPSMEEMQKRYMAHVLRLTRGKVGGEGGAQRILEMKLSSLYKKLKKYGLDKISLIYGGSQ